MPRTVGWIAFEIEFGWSQPDLVEAIDAHMAGPVIALMIGGEFLLTLPYLVTSAALAPPTGSPFSSLSEQRTDQVEDCPSVDQVRLDRLRRRLP